MSIIEDFLKKYTEMESFIKKKHPNIKDIFEDKDIKRNLGMWNFYRDLRNFLTHQYKARSGKFINLTDELYSTFTQEVNKLMYPQKAIDIAIPISKIYSVTRDEKINTVIQVMLDKNYTCTPILNTDGTVGGVFTAHSLMLYFNSHKQEIIEETSIIRIENLIKFCNLHDDPNIHYKFVPKNITVNEVKEMLRNDFTKNRRLEVIFITSNGKKTEKILALLTPWDLNKSIE